MAAWGVWVALVLVSTSPLRAQVANGQITPAGTVVTNEASVTYSTQNGNAISVAGSVSFVVGQVAGVDIDPPRIAISEAGRAVVFPHNIMNAGNGTDDFEIRAESPSGWLTEVFADTDSDGILTAADTLFTGPLTIALGESVPVLVQVTVPLSALPGTVEVVTLMATSAFDGDVIDSVSDEIRLLDAGIDAAVTKAVDRSQASPGDLLTYTMRVRLDGAGQRDSVVFEDKIPDFVTYEAGTLQLDGQNLSDTEDGDIGSYQPATGIVRIDLSALPSGVDANILLQVRVDATTQVGTQITNRARLAVHTSNGTLEEESAPTATGIAAPDLQISKTVSGLDPATEGDTLVYTIEVVNPSATLAATALTIVDTLPEPLVLERAEPAGAVSGREIRWTVPRLEPGALARFEIFTVVPAVTDTFSVVNQAWLIRDGASGESAASESRSIQPEVEASLALELEAEVVEIQLGEALPLLATVTNDGPATVADLLVKLVLPEGTRFIEERVLNGAFTSDRPTPLFAVQQTAAAFTDEGVTQGETDRARQTGTDFTPTPIQLDSFTVVGDTLYVWAPGELRPQESLELRYLLMVNSAPQGVLLNEAIASARRGSLVDVSAIAVASNQAQVLVGLTRNRALETRIVIGKVFHDRNGDGFQDPDEPGIPGVDVVTADGEMSTTDAFGKLSFNNLRPGRHAFRVDPTSVPEGLTLRTRGIGQRLQVIEVTGWNSGRLSFALDGTWLAAEGRTGSDPMSTARALPNAGTEEVDADTGALGGTNGVAPVPMGDGADGAAGADGDRRVVTMLPVARGDANSGPTAPAATNEAARRVGEVAGSSDPVAVAPLRTEEERDADERAAFLHGPSIRINAPVDGLVAPTNRLYIGVRAEPMAPVALFRGDSLLVETQLLPNGVGDFVGVELEPGPQTFRVRTLNSWGTERWDSIAVHRTGVPARLVPEDDRVVLSADGRTPTTTRVRLLDAWDVPVTNQPFVTVAMDEGRFIGRDVDPSSVGQQLQADVDGWVTIEMVGGRASGESLLLVSVPDVEVVMPVRTLAPIRPLFLTGVGQVSLGSGGDAFGALTAQGRLTDETALTLSYDTRRLDQGRDVFGGNFDPLEEGQQPILGDASTQRSLSSSRYQFSARVERGLDWVMFGDVQTSGFSDGQSLARYGRSLPGAAARLTTGPVVWNAFGASTTQALRQQQIRGSGSSGPFELGTGVLPGTEEIRVEVRALENPTRVLSEKLLTRYAEYQIDYQRGTLLLKQPVPAADPFGNPVFLLITYEGESGGDRSPVWGVRATSQASALTGAVVDSLPVSISIVNDGQAGRSFRMGAFQTAIVQESGLTLSAEVAMAEGSDSTGFATRLKGASPLFDGRVQLGAEWSRVGDEFSNPANIALRPGTDEVRASAGVRVGEAQLTAAHERQKFATRDLERSRTTVGYAQTVAEDVAVDLRLAGDASSTADTDASSGAGEYKVTWSATERLDVFGEGRNELWANGEGLANRGAYWGGGASFKLAQNFAVEARHLRVTPTGESNPYGLTSVGLTSDLRVGTKAWGSYQISGGIDGQRNAAVVGLNHRFSIGTDWRFSTMIERRNGVAGATLGDPVLASPFDQPEGNYTTASVGTEYIPQAKPYRMSFRAENRDGSLSSTRLGTLAGDVSFSAGLALLSRQEFIERDVFGSLNTRYTRERSSLWGLAYRPTKRDDLNILFKFGWKDAINPFGSGVLATDGEESRLIGAFEAIWNPRADVEFGARFATRTSRLATPLTDVTSIITRNETDFLGVRGRWFANEWAGVEIEARGLMSGLAPGAIWDVSPSLIARPVEALEVEFGYRFGDLQDPDFAVKSGNGVFLTLGTRITEDLVGSAAAFWRSRFGG